MNIQEWKKYLEFIESGLRKNAESCQVEDGVWVTNNYLIIPADSTNPHKEPWATISQYIVSWYYSGRLRKSYEGLTRPLHINTILDCYGYPGTMIFSLEGSPPKGRLVVGFQGYELTINSIAFIGYKSRQYVGMNIENIPSNLRTALDEAVKSILTKWSKTKE